MSSGPNEKPSCHFNAYIYLSISMFKVEMSFQFGLITKCPLNAHGITDWGKEGESACSGRTLMAEAQGLLWRAGQPR